MAVSTHDESHLHEHSHEADESHEHHEQEHDHSGQPHEHATQTEQAKPDVTRETVTEWTVPNPDAPDTGTQSDT